MSIVACLRTSPTPDVCDLCAALTPVVEPDAGCVWMDWTGLRPVPALAGELAQALGPAEYRLGVAPVRFAAAALAAGCGVQPAEAIPGGYWVPHEVLAAFAARLPLAHLPEISPETRSALAALHIRTLGELLSVPREFLRDRIGPGADRLLSWAQGRDPRPIRPLYPPAALHRRISSERWHPDARRLEAALGQAVAGMVTELRGLGRGCARLAVSLGHRRRERSFVPPSADSEHLGRIARRLAEQLLLQRPGPGGVPSDPEGAPAGDLIVEMTPADYPGRQTALWEPGRPRAAGRESSLAAVCARFDSLLRPRKPREAAARYEAMSRFYALW
ncbi:MAG: hypothetical protein H0Z37_06830 [Firmicutes bacterium]|nr:hypothetical protein [Bacillota bacterium]